MSDVLLTHEHHRLRAEARAFAEKEVRPKIPLWERGRAIERGIPRKMARKGWIGATVDTVHGGMGAGHLAKTILIEEISRVSGAMGAALQASQLGIAKIQHFGTEEQKKTWLPRIAAGRCLPTIAVTGPESGGHVLAIEATARREGGEYVLNGRKLYVGNSHIGDLHGIVLRTGPGSDGLSAFLVESTRAGIHLARHKPTLGLRGFSFGELTLTDCRVPSSNLLGTTGDGLAVAYSSSVIYGRLNLAAVALGIHQALLDDTVRFVTERERYGRPLGAHPTIRQKIGRMHSSLMTARHSAYLAAHLLDRGKPCDAELMNAKYVNVESAISSARTAMEIHAAAGLFTDLPIERYARDVAGLYAPAGTSDIQLFRLAEAVLQPHGQSVRQWSERFATTVTRPRSDPRQQL